MEEVRVGRFLSRFALDSEHLRQGVKTYRNFRVVYYCNEEGRPITRICSVETPDDKNWVEHNMALFNVMALLSEGEKAIRQKAEIERVSSGVRPVNFHEAAKLATKTQS